MMLAIAAAAGGQVRFGVDKQRRANQREAEYEHQQDGRDAPHDYHATIIAACHLCYPSTKAPPAPAPRSMTNEGAPSPWSPRLVDCRYPQAGWVEQDADE